MQIKQITLFLLIFLQALYAQTNLVQTFSEENAQQPVNWNSQSMTYADVNGDAYDDLVIGAPTANETGSVFIFYGGATPNATVDITLNGENSNDYFGFTIARAGDLNNDGYDDLLVHAAMEQGSGRIHVYFGGPTMDSTPDLIINPDTEMETFRYPLSLASAGDVNYDGYDDFLIGSITYNSLTGRVSVYPGGALLSSTPIQTWDGANESDNFGISLAGVGDVNKDNYDDVLIGTDRANNETGEALLFWGGASMSSTPAQTLVGENEGDQFGCTMAGNIDINNDGYDDFVVGSTGYNESTGRVYIYYGNSTFSTIPALIIDGYNTDDNFSQTLCSVGDIDNDGYDDIAVTAEGSNTQGIVYVYLGGSTMNIHYDLLMEGNSGERLGGVIAGGDMNNDNCADFAVFTNVDDTNTFYIYLGNSEPNETIDLTIVGAIGYIPGTENNFGRSVANAGDVNGDGYDDIIAGATGYNSAGAAYIYYGGPGMDNTADVQLTENTEEGYYGYAVAGVGDVNNDGYDDVLVAAYRAENYDGKVFLYLGGANMDNIADQVFTPPSSGEYFGETITGLGDFNNDGYDDYAIGTPEFDNRTGSVNIYLGSDVPDNTADMTIIGDSYDSMGSSLSGGDDFNNDGYPDLLIGGERAGYNSSGEVYIYYGGPSADTTADVTFLGQEYACYFGSYAEMVGDVNNDGFDDVMVSRDPLSVSVGDTSYAYLYYGNNSAENTPDLVFKSEMIDANPLVFSRANDLNGDGYADLIATNARYGNDQGRLYIYLGGASMDNVADAIITGNVDDNFGCSAAGLGDIDNDSHMDFIAGAYGEGNNGTAKQYYLSNNMVVTGVKVLLQGAYDADATDPIMTTNLASSIPTTSPYSDSRTVTSVPDSVVDWVWMELRSTITGVADYGRSYFLRKDGCLVDDDTNKTILDLSSQVAEGNYYIVVKHRNHLSIESASAQTFSSSMGVYDFTSNIGNTLESNAATLKEGVFGMYSGNPNGDALITNADKDPVNSNMDANGYQDGDINMDSIVTNADKDLINTNMDKTSSAVN